MGRPLVLKLAEILAEGSTVVAVDVDASAVELLRTAKVGQDGALNEKVRMWVEQGRLVPVHIDSDPAITSDETVAELAGADVIVICVQTPLQSDGETPDTRWIAAASSLIDRLYDFEENQQWPVKQRLVVLESTTYPGCTRKMLGPLAERRDFHLAYSPERMDPGSEHVPWTITRIVGGSDDLSTRLASAFYRLIFKDVHIVENLQAAEMVKLMENTYRNVLIALSNQMAMLAKEEKLDINALIDAMKTKKFGLDPCYPGLVGGHCIPSDPIYLAWWAEESLGIEVELIAAASTANRMMVDEAYDLLTRVLQSQGLDVGSAKVLIMGVAYKANVSDDRESKIHELIRRLYRDGADVTCWDPMCHSPSIAITDSFVNSVPSERRDRIERHPDGGLFLRVDHLTGAWPDVKGEILGGYFGCVVLGANHDAFGDSYKELFDTGAPPFVDLTPNSRLLQRFPDQLLQSQRYTRLGVD